MFWNRIVSRTAMQPVICGSLAEEIQRYGSHVTTNEQQERLFFFFFCAVLMLLELYLILTKDSQV